MQFVRLLPRVNPTTPPPFNLGSTWSHSRCCAPQPHPNPTVHHTVRPIWCIDDIRLSSLFRDSSVNSGWYAGWLACLCCRCACHHKSKALRWLSHVRNHTHTHHIRQHELVPICQVAATSKRCRCRGGGRRIQDSISVQRSMCRGSTWATLSPKSHKWSL